ncbi:MAG TPA: hypothetical protein DCR43_00240 [Bacteroidales bacterium]|nr:MAG: hypothetical protein A2X11_07670 [Bacteroidetes bacterium GWE2_42_24]OFY26484.1 MAG: hypothetical protein A2X09_02285 [Bacteroidetes bacterium GWF2_43_11]HAQ64280.1 hypothetical protein [Bacteroidales bacterium]HBZ67705.1 hypothetical protein [Bacteroidales bacterium]
MKPNRTITPEIHPLLPEHISADNLPLPYSRLKPSTLVMPNGTILTLVEDFQSELVRLEVITVAGIGHQTEPLQAQMCAQLLKEGARNLRGEEISETFDYHGAYISSGALPDYTMINMVVLSNHFSKVFPAFFTMITEPEFPQKSFNRILEERRQEFIINREKHPWEARRQMMNKLFGNDHPYGGLIVEDDFSKLKVDALKKFHTLHYLNQGLRVVLTGNYDSHIINSIVMTLGSMNLIRYPAPSITEKYLTNNFSGTFHLHHPESIQTALRYGCKTITMNHPDFIPLQIAVNLLGGYFGSRLNQNLREDKGYTYGIGAGIIPMKNSSVFTIGAEIDSSKTDEAIAAVENELVRLANNPPDDEELQQTLTYLAGSFLRSIDGAFALADRIKTASDFNLDYRFYVDYLNALKTITPETITLMAKKYLDPKQMVVVIVGK